MASSGSSVSSGLAGSYTWQVIFNWTRRSYDIASNTSIIDWTLSIYRSNPPAVNGTYIYEYGSNVNIDGEQVHSSSTTVQRTTNAGSLVIASGTKTIYHSADGTKSFSVSYNASLTSASNVIGGTETFTLDTIPRYANFTEHYIYSAGLNSVTVKWNADASVDWVQYSINGGNWIDTAGLTYTIGGLAPNTAYNIRTRIRRADSGLWTESGYIYATTYQIGLISSVANFNHGDNSSVVITNPSR